MTSCRAPSTDDYKIDDISHRPITIPGATPVRAGVMTAAQASRLIPAVDIVFGADGVPGAIMAIVASLGVNVPTGDYDITYQGPKIQLYLINLIKNGTAGSGGNNVTVKKGASAISAALVTGPNPGQFRTSGTIDLSQVLDAGDTLRLSVVNDGSAADTGCTIFMNGVLR